MQATVIVPLPPPILQCSSQRPFCGIQRPICCIQRPLRWPLGGHSQRTMALGRLLPLLLLAAAGFGAAGPAARPPCSAADYQPVYGACDAATGRRVGALQKRPGALCPELPSSPAVRFSANCGVRCPLPFSPPHLLACLLPLGSQSIPQGVPQCDPQNCSALKASGFICHYFD